ncbi:MAG: DNA topoisomerase I [Halobacteriaceae archaeon]
MELIVTEKDNVARRIADILAEGSVSVDTQNGVNVYRWDDKRCIGLSGHVVEIDFPTEYRNWRDVEPAELVHADVETETTREDIVAVLQSLAADADRVAIATDYDREGELIGKEALDLIQAVAPEAPVDRVRFSSITEGDVRDAFANRDDLDRDLAAAGEARQIIDLVWGAALTRFLSLTAGQRGEDFISVGRVQSPTLKLIVDREREIRAFEPETYWEVFADLGTNGEQFRTQYVYEDEDGRQAERVWVADDASAVETTLRDASSAQVTSVDRRTRTDAPPTPFDTTAFIGAAGSLGYSASRAMDIAESLYTAGYITYPRTDNTVYPDDVDLGDLLAALSAGPFGEDADRVADGDLEPTAGEEETTDHPPIHPTTDLPDRADLSDDEWEVYELVVRRFYATLAEPAVWEHLRVEATVEDYRLKANGKRLLDPGYHAVYPYIDAAETHVPDVQEGQTLRIAAVDREEKETQPPRRYGESRLIETMADLGLGTKSTRHNTIEKLYDRGYLEGDPPRPTELAMAVVSAAEEYADLVTSEEMTRELEEDMTAIAEGRATLEEVTAESRELLDWVFAELDASREELGEFLREALKADRALGPCPECGETLVLRQAGDGSHFVGCDGFPDCRYTLPLPGGGKPVLVEDRCPDHDLKHVKILDGRNTFVHGCPRCQVETANETEDRVIGACPVCGDDHGGELAIKRLQTGNRLVGCTRYPDCEYSLPLPRNGDIEVTDDRCPDHDLPELVVHDGEEPWELGCPICNYEEYQQRQAQQNVTAVDGIGEATAEKLATVGIESVGDLRGVEPEAVAEDIEGVSADRLREFKERAAS